MPRLHDIGALQVMLDEAREIHTRIEALYGVMADNGAAWPALGAGARLEAEAQSVVNALHEQMGYRDEGRVSA